MAAQRSKLEQIAGLTTEQAKKDLIRDLENEARLEATGLIRRIEEDAVDNAQMKAKRLLAMTTQRMASDYVAETTVTVLDLPSDEMKGRIIGREGRNIRAVEAATGVDIIIDDTPEAVLLSSFDPIRREVARGLSSGSSRTGGSTPPGSRRSSRRSAPSSGRTSRRRARPRPTSSASPTSTPSS